MLPKIRKTALRANKKHNLIYLNNPKVGCSTVKFNLWQAISPQTLKGQRHVHDVAQSPFINRLTKLDWAEDAKVFTFVRNPYTRVLSAYLNKIKGREAVVWTWFCKRYDLAADAEVSFDQFLELIAADDPEFLDPHWRPQHLNVMYPFITPNAIGHLEDMDGQLPAILSWALDQEIPKAKRRSSHSTGASDQLAAYYKDPATLGRAQALYADDFRFFGYSTEIAKAHLVPNTPQISEHRHTGMALLRDFTLAKGKAGRAAVLPQLRDYTATLPTSRMVEDWLLSAELEQFKGTPESLQGALQANQDALATGHAFLRRRVKTLVEQASA